MNEPKPPPFRNTSLPLIILTLVAGVALGWLLRDRFGPPAALAPTPPATRSTLAPSVAVAPSAEPAIVAPTAPPPTAPPTATALPPIPSQTPAPQPTPLLDP